MRHLSVNIRKFPGASIAVYPRTGDTVIAMLGTFTDLERSADGAVARCVSVGQ